MHKRLRHKTATFEHTKPVTSDPHKVEHNSHNKRITHTVTTATVATNYPPKTSTVVTTTRSHTVIPYHNKLLEFPSSIQHEQTHVTNQDWKNHTHNHN